MADRPDLSPDQDDEVRRLLADARHTEPMPAPVAERLDRVLAGLADEPARERTVVRLADRRRRAATMLVAAAAVVVVGVGVGQVISGHGGAGESALSSGRDEGPAAADRGSAPEAAQGGESREVGAARVRPDRFAADVAGLRGERPRSTYAAQDGKGATEEGDRDHALRGKTTVCAAGDWGAGSYRAVRYGKAVGYLVFRRPQGDSQVVDLFLCGSEQVARSVTLPRR